MVSFEPAELRGEGLRNMQSSLWTEHKAADGRLYWNNTQTRVSVWERPDELKSPAERALASTPWKEYQTPEGKKYWFHSQTKQTVWELPPEVKAAVERALAADPAPQPNGAATPQPAAPAQSGPPAGFAPAPVPASLPQRPAFQAFVPATALPSSGNAYQTIPEFHSVGEAEQAFKGMLREKGVTPKWTWEQTMRQMITEPLFKALETMAERKAAFESFVESERRSAQEQRERNIAKAKPTFKSTLDRLGEKNGPDGQLGPPVRSWWTFERLSKEVEQRAPELWKLSKEDDERKVLWDEYLAEFKRKERVAEESLRDRQRAKLRALLNDPESVGLGPHLENVPWRQGHPTLVRSHAVRDDPDLRSMEDLQMLVVWEDEVKRAEREANEVRQRDKEARRRSGRKARTAFKALLEELKGAGMIRAGTLWKEVYPSIERDERFTDLLGTDGSSPLDLFWDAVDEFDEKVEGLERVVEHVLEAKGKTVEEQTELEDFREWVRGAEQLEARSDRDLKAVFLNMQDRAARRAQDERRRAERRLRNATEDLRYALKKLSPPIEVDVAYEAAVSRFSDLPEYEALEGHEEERRDAFKRYIDRLKEKAEDKRSRASRKDDVRRGDGTDEEDGSVSSAHKRRRRDDREEGEYRPSSPRSGHERSSRRHRSSRYEDRDDTRHRDRDRDQDADRYRDRDRDADRDHRDRDRKGRDRDGGERDKRRAVRYDDVDDDGGDDRKSSGRRRDDRDKRPRTRSPDRLRDGGRGRESKRPRTSAADDREEGEL